jgi:hypothetical protein
MLAFKRLAEPPTFLVHKEAQMEHTLTLLCGINNSVTLFEYIYVPPGRL